MFYSLLLFLILGSTALRAEVVNVGGSISELRFPFEVYEDKTAKITLKDILDGKVDFMPLKMRNFDIDFEDSFFGVDFRLKTQNNLQKSCFFIFCLYLLMNSIFFLQIVRVVLLKIRPGTVFLLMNIACM